MQLSNINYAKFISYISTQRILPNVQTVSSRLNLSSRKIYYLLQIANSDLRSSNQPFLVPNTRITESQISVLNSKLLHDPSGEYINSYERQLIIDICIALPLKKWTLSSFQSLFGVSRNTVLRDIADLKKRKKFKPEFSKKTGFEFKETLYDSLVHAYNSLVLLQSHNIPLNCFLNSLDNGISYSKFLLVSEKLKNMYKDLLEKRISISNALTLTIFSVIASLYAARCPISEAKLFNPSDIESFTKRKEHNIICDFSLVAETNFSIHIVKPVQLFLTLQLLSITKEQDDHFSSHSFQDLLILSEHIVDSFMAISHIKGNSSERGILTREIQTQLKPFWYSVRYQNITVYEYLYHEPIFENYVTESLKKMNDYPLYNHLFPFGLLPDQISILAMIFYNFSLSHQKIVKLKILMITSLPIYSQNLFKTIIQKYSNVPCELSIRALNNSETLLNDINNFDLIITESTEISTKQPTFLIDSELKESEFDRLRTVIEEITPLEGVQDEK
ncbi:transcriptional antiterminator [Leuconostoc carnosum]|uniref:transcriptional antiterminator n=1 Tax=Leuconostoc carnosum TaxID=1252 RepID=UPI00123921F8|nr:transcriptional antiterminator [Leuconostoc carnosum]KAA8371396.1 transcriptional antiterminator [Leuconostoc carnosum]KAA8383117.1 transcriptional antiterminator [Leuconostoc carnosum]